MQRGLEMLAAKQDRSAGISSSRGKHKAAGAAARYLLTPLSGQARQNRIRWKHHGRLKKALASAPHGAMHGHRSAIRSSGAREPTVDMLT